ncbi:MAG: hypothetical protein A3F13_02200 [Gammaproteobacteria bacterium RIFCSPHIGHO2_12_FULL_40_19]|nr:MAG: hypothetical protein A3F13_02200 [Gammaproteobacteria bacterium RIFCSPHIGHO2_12_FULL_40_19]
MFTRYLITAAFLAILYCLGSGAFYLTKVGRGTSLAKALTWRIILALLLFGFLFFAHYMGWMQPHGLAQPSTP